MIHIKAKDVIIYKSEVIEMKKIKKIMGNVNVASMLASLALVFSFVAANSRCYFIYHQPKMPEKLSEMKRH